MGNQAIALVNRIGRLEQAVAIAEDVSEIRRLQYLYGYYVDNHMWAEMADLFAEDAPEIEVGSRGCYVGKDRILQFLTDVLGRGKWGLRRNELANHIQVQPIISVAADRRTARARARAFIQVSAAPNPHGMTQRWSEGPYENEYVREHGVWKIKRLWAVVVIYSLMNGSGSDDLPQSGPDANFPPDAPSLPVDPRLGRSFPPYHLAHPITGATVPSPATGTAADMQERS